MKNRADRGVCVERMVMPDFIPDMSRCRNDCHENCQPGCYLAGALYYKGWEIAYIPKPIGTKKHDYDAVHPAYDGADCGNGLYLTAESVDACHKAIDNFIEENK